MNEVSLITQLEAIAKTSYHITLNENSKQPAIISEIESHFGGIPYLSQAAGWPNCGKCHNPLDFILQIDQTPFKKSLPGEFGFFRLFYCWECMPGVLLKDPKNLMSAFSHVKKVNWSDFVQPTESLGNVTNYARISFQEGMSLPCYQELVRDFPEIAVLLAAELKKLQKQNPEYLNFNNAEFYEEISHQLYDAGGFTFLGGYPQWLGKIAEPQCNICKQKMKFLMQIDSEDAVDLNWGNQGCAYLFYCAKDIKEYSLVIQN